MNNPNNPLNYIGSGALQAIVAPTYPANDITATLQADAADGTTTTLSQNSVFHQVVNIPDDWTLDLNGYTLQMFGLNRQRIIYGAVCTGPAAWFLDGNGYPLGNPNATHPAGVQRNVFQTKGASNPTFTFGSGTFDDNITQYTDTWGGAIFVPEDDGPIVSNDLTVINPFGGTQWYPDPIHIDADGTEVTNYTFGFTSAITPTGSDSAGGLICGKDTALSDVVVTDADMNGFLEFDGVLTGAEFSNVTGTHVLFGDSISSPSDWGGATFYGMTFSRPSNDVLVIDAVLEDLTMGESGAPCSFTGTIVNGSNFQGTWYSGNTPSSP